MNRARSTQRSPWRALLQDVDLMPQHQDLGRQLLSRLEVVAQHADEQEADRNHAAIMF
jgi:ribosomal protein L13